MKRPTQVLTLLKRVFARSPFTVTGRLLLVATAFGLLAIGDSSLAGLLSYLATVLAVFFTLGLWFRPNLTARAMPLPLIHCGDRFKLKIQVANTGLNWCSDLRFGLLPTGAHVEFTTPDVLVEHLEPGESRTLEFDAIAHRRGASLLSLQRVAGTNALAHHARSGEHVARSRRRARRCARSSGPDTTLWRRRR